MKKEIAKDKWIWMPHAGHFILSNKCRFFLNTRVGKYIVSTVGELWPERISREIHAEVYDPKWLEENKHLLGDYFDNSYFKKFGYQKISLDNEYETMVFRARKSKHKCCPWGIIVSEQVDFNDYDTSEDAYKGHLKLCKKWAKKYKKL